MRDNKRSDQDVIDPARSAPTLERERLIAPAVTGDAPPVPSVPSVPPVPSVPRRRPRARADALTDRLLYSAAMLSALYLIWWLWYFGAVATLHYLGTLIDLSRYGWTVWIIPLGITLVEMYTVPLLRRPAWLVFYSAVLLFDVGTTAFGIVELARDLRLPVINMPIPNDWPLWIGSVAGGLAAALLPERLARQAIGELVQAWKE